MERVALIAVIALAVTVMILAVLGESLESQIEKSTPVGGLVEAVFGSLNLALAGFVIFFTVAAVITFGWSVLE